MAVMHGNPTDSTVNCELFSTSPMKVSPNSVSVIVAVKVISIVPALLLSNPFHAMRRVGVSCGPFSLYSIDTGLWSLCGNPHTDCHSQRQSPKLFQTLKQFQL